MKLFKCARILTPLPETWKMASQTPAMILGIDKQKGEITPGHDADFLAINAELEVAGVFYER